MYVLGAGPCCAFVIVPKVPCVAVVYWFIAPRAWCYEFDCEYSFPAFAFALVFWSVAAFALCWLSHRCSPRATVFGSAAKVRTWIAVAYAW